MTISRRNYLSESPIRGKKYVKQVEMVKNKMKKRKKGNGIIWMICQDGLLKSYKNAVRILHLVI